MTLGESAGRSAGNTPRASARRRNTEDERAFRTHLLDDPNAWPDEHVFRRRWRAHLHDGIVGVSAGGWCLFLVGIGALSVGWLSRVAYGLLVASFAAVALAAFGSRRSS